MSDLEQLRHNCEYHRGVACMVAADSVLELFTTFATLTEQLEHTERESFARYEAHLKAEAQLAAAEKVCEAAEGFNASSGGTALVVDRVKAALADWRRTKEGA